MTTAESALEERHALIRGCVRCPLHLTRTQAVPGFGPASARIMAIGEAPGEKEDRQGRPFVGAAGQVLTRLLEAVGLDRDDIYITNTVKCRPPQNRDPEAGEVAACAAHLDSQIEIVNPDVILLLGRHATARMLPECTSISRVHGERVIRGERTYVPLYHPAAALYNGSMMATLQNDMQRVKGYLEEAAAARRQRVPAMADADTDEEPVEDHEQLSLF